MPTNGSDTSQDAIDDEGGRFMRKAVARSLCNKLMCIRGEREEVPLHSLRRIFKTDRYRFR